MDITIRDIPNDLTEKEIVEWVNILVERHLNKQLVVPQEIIDSVKSSVDSFRTANQLEAKYTIQEVIKA